MTTRILTVVAVALGVFSLLGADASASELIARSAQHVSLDVSKNGQSALLSYTTRGRTWYVLASGAVNARAPVKGHKQVSFKLVRSTTRPAFRGTCGQYPAKLPFLVESCTAGGSYWAVQEWQRALPNFGAKPNAFRAQPELRLSHWTGPVAKLTLKSDWSYDGKWEHLYGDLTYLGHAVHGFGSTTAGVPTDDYGRNIYLDTLDSAYGPGWHRENSFLTHNPSGGFCYGLTPHRAGLTGRGKMYRGAVIGPGVSPDVSATAASPGVYSPQADALANQEQFALFTNDRLCKPN
jgi:hypothetical protein